LNIGYEIYKRIRFNSGATKKSAEIVHEKRDFPSWGMDGYVRIRPGAGNAVGPQVALIDEEKVFAD
jgi:hypothetical protein